MTTTASLWVCERAGDWADALRAAAMRRSAELPRIVEIRSTAELRERAIDARRTGTPPIVVVVEITLGNADAVCDTVVWWTRQMVGTPLAVVAEREFAACEVAAREAGTTLFLVSRRDLSPVWEIFERCKRADRLRATTVMVDDERPAAERVWASLPLGS